MSHKTAATVAHTIGIDAGRRIRDLVAPAAFQGLSQNEIGCARIS
jgi:hypothetical protein